MTDKFENVGTDKSGESIVQGNYESNNSINNESFTLMKNGSLPSNSRTQDNSVTITGDPGKEVLSFDPLEIDALKFKDVNENRTGITRDGDSMADVIGRREFAKALEQLDPGQDSSAIKALTEKVFEMTNVDGKTGLSKDEFKFAKTLLKSGAFDGSGEDADLPIVLLGDSDDTDSSSIDFASFNSDGSNAVNRDEFKQGLVDSGRTDLETNAKTTDLVYSMFNRDGQAGLSEAEFKDASFALDKVDNDAEAENISDDEGSTFTFDSINQSGNDVISRKELRQGLSDTHISLDGDSNAAVVDDIFNQFNVDGQNGLSREEFKQLQSAMGASDSKSDDHCLVEEDCELSWNDSTTVAGEDGVVVSQNDLTVGNSTGSFSDVRSAEFVLTSGGGQGGSGEGGNYISFGGDDGSLAAGSFSDAPTGDGLRVTTGADGNSAEVRIDYGNIRYADVQIGGDGEEQSTHRFVDVSGTRTEMSEDGYETTQFNTTEESHAGTWERLMHPFDSVRKPDGSGYDMPILEEWWHDVMDTDWEKEQAQI